MKANIFIYGLRTFPCFKSFEGLQSLPIKMPKPNVGKLWNTPKIFPILKPKANFGKLGRNPMQILPSKRQN